MVTRVCVLRSEVKIKRFFPHLTSSLKSPRIKKKYTKIISLKAVSPGI